MKRDLTTGQVAKKCGVSAKTVQKWFDTGRLKGHRIPGGLDRRIPRINLIRFLKENDVPLGELEQHVLLVGVDTATKTALLGEFSGEAVYVASVDNIFDAGVQTSILHPYCIVVDIDHTGVLNAFTLVVRLKKYPEHKETPIIGLVLRDSKGDKPEMTSCFTETFRKPFDAALLAARIKTHIERSTS